MRILLLLLLSMVSLVMPATAGDVVVVDGDTLDLDAVRYRIHGIDAPEAGQRCSGDDGETWRCGSEAVRKLEELVFSARKVTCDAGPLDNYGRMLSVCWADGKDIGRQMVAAGLAWSYERYSSDYAADELEARKKALGIWQASTQPAWEYRAERWSASIEAAPDEQCPIKGNINKAGEQIYHTPWSPDYDRTKIDLSKGERWFCDEAEALAAGWRAAHWGRLQRR